MVRVVYANGNHLQIHFRVLPLRFECNACESFAQRPQASCSSVVAFGENQNRFLFFEKTRALIKLFLIFAKRTKPIAQAIDRDQFTKRKQRAGPRLLKNIGPNQKVDRKGIGDDDQNTIHKGILMIGYE